MATKTTNKTALLFALENLPDAPADIREKWENMVAQLDKKNAAPRKLTAKQEANAVTAELIADFLVANSGTGFTVSDLIKSIPELNGDTPQHVSALMRNLLATGAVEKYTDKRRSYFKAVA